MYFMHIDLLIENTLRNSKLKRVRVKVDPSELAVFGYENVCSFEGYVLEECGTSVKVYMLNVPKEIDPVQDVEKKHVTPIEEPPLPTSFKNVKSKIIEALKKQGIDQTVPQIKQIENSNSLDFIETFLRELKFDEKKISDLYKAVLLAPPVSEQSDEFSGFGRNLPNTGEQLMSGLKQGVDITGKTLAKAGELLMGKNHILRRLATFLRTFDPKDLINIQTKSKDYEHAPNKNDLVQIMGVRGIKTIKGIISGQSVLQLPIFGSYYEVSNLSPKISKLTNVYLDLKLYNNPEKKGNIIFGFTDNIFKTAQARIDLVGGIWMVRVTGLTAPTESYSSSTIKAIVSSLGIIKEILFIKDYNSFKKMPDHDELVNAIANKLDQLDQDKWKEFDQNIIGVIEDEPGYQDFSISQKISFIKSKIIPLLK